MEAKKVLVLGARGRLGAAVVDAFAHAGWEVVAQTRRPQQTWPAGVVELCCDALDTEALVAVGRSATAVVNGLNPLYTEWEALAMPLAEQGIAVAKALDAVLLYPGNVYNYGRELQEHLGPDTPFAVDGANTPKGRLRVAIEARLEEESSGGLRSVVLRAGDFFGGEATGSWLDLVLLERLSADRFTLPGPADRVHAWAYLPDVARAFVAVAERADTVSGCERLHFEGHAVPLAELQASVERVVGRPLRARSMAWGWLRLATPFSPMLRAIYEMRYLWERPHALDGAALRARVGPLPHTPLDEAMARTLEALGHATRERAPQVQLKPHR